MNASDYGREISIDLSTQRMLHLPKEASAKMLHIKLLGKESAVYEMGEILRYELTMQSNKRIEYLCTRLEIRSADGASVGAIPKHNFTSMAAGESKIFEFGLDLQGIVPGRYLVLLVLYEVNEWGTYDDLDAVFPAFAFEIYDSANRLAISWNKAHWGNICFSDLTCQEKKE